MDPRRDRRAHGLLHQRRRRRGRCADGSAGAGRRRARREQRAAAAVVGYEGVDFLHRPDGALENDLALREQLVRIIRKFKPDAVVCMDPTVVITRGGFIQHVDHRNAAMAAVDAVYPASRNAMAFPHLVIDEGLEPHNVDIVYLFFTDQADIWVDTSDTIDTKIAALQRAHKPAAQAREARRDAARLVGRGRPEDRDCRGRGFRLLKMNR